MALFKKDKPSLEEIKRQYEAAMKEEEERKKKQQEKEQFLESEDINDFLETEDTDENTDNNVIINELTKYLESNGLEQTLNFIDSLKNSIIVQVLSTEDNSSDTEDNE